MILTFSYALKQSRKLAQMLYLIICGDIRVGSVSPRIEPAGLNARVYPAQYIR